MLQIILSIILIITLILSIIVVVKKRKKAGTTGIKSALTSICFFIAIINLLAYWFNFMGLFVWFINFILLILGAYFTKYIRISES